ncbi:N-acetylmuramoyl-L-alanine amidase [Zooshikella harenae]|uniref:N-acetylmuramoyl-L-alanine amidase n=1 Tax=Zooshikella harenae TaxID=2827238 RepID=A0ABS5ZIN3_9GAMM|nr:N-acetylmuramoyl-L-alanine amidase [Zooshikella harenae]MBU2713934.1 N-acetylmuramoyl-L-alanine amidase [Zooshikella harenae]
MKITKLVVHCADTPNDRDVTAEDIHQWHIQRKWAGIGYHRVIRRNGVIEQGRPEYWEGAHVKGYNSTSLGVCLIGRDQFTDAQMQSLERVLRDWKVKYPNADICGHCDLDPHKTCPNFDVKGWWETVNQKELVSDES